MSFRQQLRPSTRRSAARRIGAARRSDAGMTLVETVLAITIAGFIMASIGISMVVIVRSDKPTTERLTEAKDVAFLQTYLPVDYSSAVSRDVNPLLQPVAGQTLAGTNVLTLIRNENSVTIITSYRYEQVGTDWQLTRYESGNPRNGGELTRTVVAHQLAEPPAGWTSSETPSHAVMVNARNQTTVRPVGDDMQLTFKSGNSFSTGGSGLSANTELPDASGVDSPDAAAIKSRCGGRITLLLDASGSIGGAHAESQVRNAAIGFINAFKGTPSDISIVKFGTTASMTYPATGGQYFSVLDPAAPAITSAVNAVNAITFPPTNLTNWEDGIYWTYRNAGGSYPLQSELVVFVTDGDPNVIRNPPANWYDNWNPSAPWRLTTATEKARLEAENSKATEYKRMVGIAVGLAANSAASVARMKTIVGNTEWNGTVNADGSINVGNAANADLFVAPGGDFSKLGSVLKAVAAGECGGTVTIQKKIDDGAGNLSDSTKVWTYTSEIGSRELNPNTQAAITLEYTFAAGENQKQVQITETGNAGFELDRVECRANGVVLGNDRVEDAPDHEPGVIVTVKANDAISCTFISKAE